MRKLLSMSLGSIIVALANFFHLLSMVLIALFLPLSTVSLFKHFHPSNLILVAMVLVASGSLFYAAFHKFRNLCEVPDNASAAPVAVPAKSDVW